MNTQAYYGFLVPFHPSDKVFSFRVETFDSAINTSDQIFSFALQIIGQSSARYTQAVQSHVSIVVQVKHVNGAVKIARQKSITNSVKTQVSEFYLLGGQGEFVANCAFYVQK
jgi:hypothetical protein